MSKGYSSQLFLERFPDLVKHLVVNDMTDIESPDISITARTKELYDRHLFPDLTSVKIDRAITNKRILDIGCGYNPIYDDSFINYVVNNPKLNCEIKGIDIIDMDMPNYKKTSIFTVKDEKGVDYILINNLLYFWINKPKDLLKIYANLEKSLKPGGEIRVFPVYMDNFTMDSEDVKRLINNKFFVRTIIPHYHAEDPFYQDKEADEIYVLEGLGERETKINKMLKSTTLILKKPAN